MFGPELSSLHNISERYVRLMTQKAIKEKALYIELKGKKYYFETKVQGRGRPAYVYSEIKSEIVKKEFDRSTSVNLNISLLPAQKENLEKKLFIISSYSNFKGTVDNFVEYVQKHIDKTYTKKKHFDWQRAYKNGGAGALIDKRGAKKGVSTRLKEWEQRFLIKGFRAWAAGGINYTQLWEEMHREDAENKGYSFTDWKMGKVKDICDVTTVMRFIKNYYEKRVIEWTLITQGEDANKSLNQPAMGSRKELYLTKNECWEIDSSPADIIIFEDGKQMRPDILAIKDCYSGRCVATLAHNSNSLAITRLLWKAIETLGVPKSIKTDNGKDYVSKQFTMLLNNLGIKPLRATAYAGDEKGQVERNFRTIQHSYISVLAGFIGHNLAKRQKIEQQTAKKDRKAKDEFGNAIKTQTPSSQLLNWEQLDDKLQEAVLLWEIDKKRRKGPSPVELWNNCLAKVETMEYENFLIFAGGYTSRKVNKEGINFDGRTYQSNFLHKYRGQNIYVVENIDNMSEIFVFDDEGSYIGRCFDKKMGTLSKEELMGMKRWFNKETRELQKTISDDRISARGKATLKVEYRRIKDEHQKSLKQNGPIVLDSDDIKSRSKKLGNKNIPNFEEVSTLEITVGNSEDSLYSDMAIDYD